MIYGNTTSFLVAVGLIQHPSNRDTRKTRPWSRAEAPGGGPAGPVCWKESRELGHLLGFLWQKEVQLSMQLLPTRAGTVNSECSTEPGIGDWSRGEEGKAGWQQARHQAKRDRKYSGLSDIVSYHCLLGRRPPKKL